MGQRRATHCVIRTNRREHVGDLTRSYPEKPKGSRETRELRCRNIMIEKGENATTRSRRAAWRKSSAVLKVNSRQSVELEKLPSKLAATSKNPSNQLTQQARTSRKMTKPTITSPVSALLASANHRSVRTRTGAIFRSVSLCFPPIIARCGIPIWFGARRFGARRWHSDAMDKWPAK